jgi:predicted MFS family arabinose efflux permease
VAAAALGTFLVSAAIESGLDEAEAGWLQFAGSGASIGARIASGLVVDRGHGSLSGLIVLLGAGSLVFLAVPLSMGVLFVVVVMAAYATGWGWPGLMTATVVDSDRNAAASRSAITQAGVFFGAGGAPLVLGVVAERWSFDHMWLLVAGCLAVGAVLALSVAGRRSEQPST